MKNEKTQAIILGLLSIVLLAIMAYGEQTLSLEAHYQYGYRVEGNPDADATVLGWLDQLATIHKLSWLWYVFPLLGLLPMCLLALSKIRPSTQLALTLLLVLLFLATLACVSYTQASIWLRTFGSIT